MKHVTGVSVGGFLSCRPATVTLAVCLSWRKKWRLCTVSPQTCRSLRFHHSVSSKSGVSLISTKHNCDLRVFPLDVAKWKKVLPWHFSDIPLHVSVWKTTSWESKPSAIFERFLQVELFPSPGFSDTFGFFYNSWSHGNTAECQLTSPSINNWQKTRAAPPRVQYHPPWSCWCWVQEMSRLPGSLFAVCSPNTATCRRDRQNQEKDWHILLIETLIVNRHIFDAFSLYRVCRTSQR